MQFFLTGVTGYLGSHVARKLVDQGYSVTGLVRETSKLCRLNDFINNLELITYKNLSDLEKVFIDSEYIVCHFATCYGRNKESLRETIEANLVLPIILLQLTANKKKITFCNCGTSLPKFINPYSLSKAQFSEWGQLLSEVNDIIFIDLLMEHFYGPGDDNSKFISNIISKLKEKNTRSIDLTLGEQIRDFIYIDDAVSAILTVLKAVGSNLILSKYIKVPVGYGEGISIKQIVEKIHYKLNSSAILNFGALPYRKNEVMYSVADISFLRSLGWQPQYRIDDGIEEILHERKK